MDDRSVEEAPHAESVIHADRNEWVIGLGRGLDNATQVILLISSAAQSQAAAVYPN